MSNAKSLRLAGALDSRPFPLPDAGFDRVQTVSSARTVTVRELGSWPSEDVCDGAGLDIAVRREQHNTMESLCVPILCTLRWRDKDAVWQTQLESILSQSVATSYETVHYESQTKCMGTLYIKYRNLEPSRHCNHTF